MKIINLEIWIEIKNKKIEIKKFKNKYRVTLYKKEFSEYFFEGLIILPNDKNQIPEMIKQIFKTPT